MLLFFFILILIPNLLSQSDLQTKYDSASKYAKQGNYGNALLRYLEIASQDPNYRDVQNKIASMKASIRDRVTFRVALFDFKNYSNSPGMVGRIQDGILDFLLNKSFGTLEIVDRSAIDQFQREAARTDTKLAKLKPISAVIEGSIYDLKVEENKAHYTETKTVEIGTHKVPNPKRVELLSAVNAMRFQEADYSALHQSQTNRVMSGAFSTLFNLKQASKKQLATSGIEFLRLLGTSGSKGKVENKIKELEREMSNLPEFIEEPVYGDVVKDEETVARIARMDCYLKIRDFKTQRPLYTQTFESLKSAAGLSLNIPSKIELESMVTSEVINSAGNKIYEELRGYGLGYYSLFELDKDKGDRLSAVEMVFNYLLSCSSPYNPEQTINCAQFINKSIGLESDSSLLANYFPAIESAKEYLEEQKRHLAAKEIFEEGKDLYSKEDYEAAIEKFKQAKEQGFYSDDIDKYITDSGEKLAELEKEKITFPAKNIIRKAANAMGGFDKIKNLQSMTLAWDGTITTSQQEIHVGYKRFIIYPDKARTEIYTSMGQITSVFNGEEAWVETSQGIQDVPAKEVKKDLFRDWIQIIKNLENEAVTYQYLGEEYFQGVKAHTIYIFDQEANMLWLYIDKASFHIVGEKYIDSLYMSPPGLIIIIFNEIKEVGGIKYPFKHILTHNGKPAMSLNAAEIKVNPKIQLEIFLKK